MRTQHQPLPPSTQPPTPRWARQPTLCALDRTKAAFKAKGDLWHRDFATKNLQFLNQRHQQLTTLKLDFFKRKKIRFWRSDFKARWGCTKKTKADRPQPRIFQNEKARFFSFCSKRGGLAQKKIFFGLRPKEGFKHTNKQTNTQTQHTNKQTKTQTNTQTYKE